MSSHRLFHTVVTLYEKYRAEALGDLLGISPMAIRVLDIVLCLPGSRIEDVEHLLTSTRAKVVSAVFELSGRGLLTSVDPSVGYEDIRLYAEDAATAIQEADVFRETAPALEAYREILLEEIRRWASDSGERTSKSLLSALAKAETGDGVVVPSGPVH
ncbi:hypothetical protein [Burkholderia multivorans]|uniref:hypothetical protein n=1 Tax=Burkholderia multivorans TaxID=87883 RepID=UPI0012D98330|nr:hypothetical protein [Burkholderia multivorans]